MGRININLNDIPDQDGLPAPEGDYILRVSGLPKKKKSKSSDNEMISLTFKIVETVEGETEIEGYPIKDKPIFHNFVLHPDSMGMPNGLKRGLKCMGMDWDESGFDTDDMMDLTVGAKLGIKEYEGKESNEIIRFFALGEDD